jgi:hypothetical protein
LLVWNCCCGIFSAISRYVSVEVLCNFWPSTVKKPKRK